MATSVQPYSQGGTTEPHSRASTGLTYQGGNASGRSVPILAEPMGPDDGYDGARISLVRNRWTSQDAALLPYSRTVEKIVRMIVGKQWDKWVPSVGQYVDVSQWFTDSEKKWRQNPVINYMMNWYMLTHARLTENPPIVTFQPATADEVDAKLAEAMDTIWKTLWRDLDMNNVLDMAMAYLIPGGTVYLKSGVDYSQGDDTYVPVPQQDGSYVLQMGKEGMPTVDVLDPLSCRGQWGSMPWHKKKWHIHTSFLTPEEVFEKWNVWVNPDSWQGSQTDGTGGYLQRLQFGSGYYGAAENKGYGQTVQGIGNAAASQEGFVQVYEMWEAPNGALPGYAMTDSEPGGRLLVCTHNKRLYDGNRPFAYKYCSPIRELVFTNMMGRPKGSTPAEMLVPIQETMNRGVRQILEHRNLMSNPSIVIDNASGIQEGQVTNEPGLKIYANVKPGVDPIRYLQPAPLSPDVWRTQDWLEKVINFLGNTTGATGDAPTDDPSGVAIKQLRYNSDRYIGPTVKRAVVEIVRLIEDQMVMLPAIWTEEKILSFMGDDDVAVNVAIYPEMWEGNIRIQPDMDSMIPEGREERQSRITTLYQLGAFGAPGSPPAANALLELIKFPHMNRLDVAGGVDRITAKKAMGQLARGTPAQMVDLYPFYNLDVWQGTFRDFMAGTEFLDLPDPAKEQFILMMEKIQGAQVAAQIQAMQRAAPLTALQGAMQNQVMAAAGPPPGMVGGGPPGAHGAPQPGGGSPAHGPPHGDHAAGTPNKGALAPAPQPLNTPQVQDA